MLGEVLQPRDGQECGGFFWSERVFEVSWWELQNSQAGNGLLDPLPDL